MKSKKALFNTGIGLNFLKRYWPMWLGYLIVLMMVIPGGILPQLDISHLRSEEDIFYRILDINRSILYTGRSLIGLSAFTGIVAAMVMYSFMYNSRSVTMMCALPVRRETLFITAFLTGLVPMLLIDILVLAVTAVPALTGGFAESINLLRLLGMLCLSNIAFYCFGVFCAVLTGNIVVLPVVYLVLNVAAVLAEQAVRSVLDIVVYGFGGSAGELTAFSPIAAADTWFYPKAEMEEIVVNGHRQMRETGVFTVEYFYLLFIYCAVGLALVALALHIYRRRDMECAGDVVAVPVLKPIFKYCMCFGVAFCFAAVVYSNIFYSHAGITEALIVLLLLLVGAFIGYFVSEMLLQKTLRVFRGKWKGYIVSALVLCCFMAVVEFDMTGYEKLVPSPDEIEMGSFSYYENTELEEYESLDMLTAYHAQLIGEKNANENAETADMIHIEYTLTDGRTISRRYPIAKDEAQLADKGSSINRLFALVNMQEAIDRRAATELPVTENNVQDGWFSGYYVDRDEQYHHFEYELTAKETADFYNNCVLPDASEGRLKRIFPINNEEYYSFATTVNFSFGQKSEDYRHYYYDFVMYMDARRCVEWIEENTDIELMPIKEADWRAYENDSIYYASYKPTMDSASSVAVIG